MFFIDKLNYFLITRAKSVVAYLKKFTEPRYVIAFVVIYPHIYTNILNAVSAAQTLMVNIADQFYSWIESAFWGVFNYIRSKLGGMWFGDQIAYVLAGITMALPFLVYTIFKHAFIPVANTLLIISLNVLGVVYYIFCRVVIPALKQAFGAYLFAKFMPASYKYVAKALERFAQGRFGGFFGALFGAVAPFSGFFIGPLIISIATDSACRYAVGPLTVAPPYQVPYTSPTVYHYVLDPTTSWLIASLYGQFIQQTPLVASYISAFASWEISKLLSYSYIVTGVYGWSYYPGAYAFLIPAYGMIYPSLRYSVAPGPLPDSYSYISAHAPIFVAMIHDISFLTGPPYIHAYISDMTFFTGPLYVHAYIYEYSYLTELYPPPYYVYAYIQDLSYLMLPPTINTWIYDLSYLTYLEQFIQH